MSIRRLKKALEEKINEEANASESYEKLFEMVRSIRPSSTEEEVILEEVKDVLRDIATDEYMHNEELKRVNSLLRRGLR